MASALAVFSAPDLGTAIVVAVAIVVGFFVLIRGRADVWKSNYEAERGRGDRLEKEVSANAQRLLEAQQRVTALEALPSLAQLSEMVAKHNATEQVILERVTDSLDRISRQLDTVATKLNGSRR